MLMAMEPAAPLLVTPSKVLTVRPVPPPTRSKFSVPVLVKVRVFTVLGVVVSESAAPAARVSELEVLTALALPRTKTPALTAVAPVKVLAPERVRVPAPVLVSVPAPLSLERIPERVIFLAAAALVAAWKVVPAAPSFMSSEDDQVSDAPRVPPCSLIATGRVLASVPRVIPWRPM